MAPRGRGRPRKMNTRTDAALDAMRSFGFPDDLTLNKLKELLDVYGEENWFFIEENSYEVLREGILEQQEKEEQQKNPEFLLPALPAVSCSLALPVVPCSSALPVIDIAAGIPSRCCHRHRHRRRCRLRCSCSFSTNSPERGVAIATPCSETEALSIVLATNEFVEDSTSQTYGVLDASLNYKTNGNGRFLPSANGTESSLQNINLDENSGRENTPTAIAFPRSNHPQEPKDGFPIRSRRPCHGWICSDDEFSESDLVELEPAPSPEEFLKLLTRVCSTRQRKRKTRWDLRPEDI